MTRLRYIHTDTSRHGTRRVYFWRGKGTAKVRLLDPVGSAAFHERYAALLRETEHTPILPQPSRPAAVPIAGTLGALISRYQASTAFLAYDAATIRKRRHLFSVMISEPVHPGAVETYRDFPVDRLTSSALAVLRDRAAHTVGQANERVKALRALFKWAADPSVMLTVSNPAQGVALTRVTSDGHHSWTLAEIEQFEARHPPGTRAHLVLQIALYTGARRSDIVRLGKPHRRGDQLRWTAWKGRKKSPTVIEIDILPPLAEALERGPVGDITWLVNDLGRPFTVAGFGNWFRDRCTEAGLPHCSAHGLRKAGATRAAENGATAHMLMAIFGWATLKEAERYTRAAERKRMASAGMATLLQAKR